MAGTEIRGVLPSSMIDWPGKICAVVFLAGCNFRCPYCHNPELVEEAGGKEAVAWEDLAAYLEDRAGWIDGVCITGGEPTIHADLPALCRRLKALGLEVKLDTNGSRPRVLYRLLEEELVDCVAMDLKTSLDRYPALAGRPLDVQAISESAGIIVSWGGEHEFRCTVVPGWVGYAELEELARMVQGARRLVLQQFRPEHTLDPAYQAVEPYPDELLLRWSEELSVLVSTRVRGLNAMRMGT
ncbi:MAG: anaerobic ribonucleoside-triphosphate reductase activating protein [Actinomycetota bacterium]|nr:anaerobic ribonucleoside-triphosphate reductase activating protein [Actinomycetota bacterium]